MMIYLCFKKCLFRIDLFLLSLLPLLYYPQTGRKSKHQEKTRTVKLNSGLKKSGFFGGGGCTLRLPDCPKSGLPYAGGVPGKIPGFISDPEPDQGILTGPGDVFCRGNGN